MNETGRVAGVDEAGRGPLAGPVVVAAVTSESGPMVPAVAQALRRSEARKSL